MLNIFRKKMKQFRKENISKLRYAMIHSLFGDAEGVSIVMKQIEEVLNKHLRVPKRNIFYLIGKSKVSSPRITTNEILWNHNKVNKLMLDNYHLGYGGEISEKIELAINKAKKVIGEFIKKNRIDILIAHNTSHPINFITSVALSRYYRDAILAGKKTPKYILWWHDSHLERKDFLSPAREVENYLLQGVPGHFVEYVIFINSLQFKDAKKYFKKLDERNPGFYKNVRLNHDVVFNTTETFIDSFKDLESGTFDNRVEEFMNDFKVKEFLKKKKVSLGNVLFCLQHTRMVPRKRIDFALKYIYELLKELKKKGYYRAIYFLVSGHDVANTKKSLIKLNRQLKKEYGLDKVFLVFAEDYYDKTEITFEEYPKIFAKLGGISTYFSDVEGFGNNLLEVLASGLIPAVYIYPVYKKDIAKYKFKIIDFAEFKVDEDKIADTISVIRNKTKRKEWVNYNLKILKRHFPHKTMAVKLVQAITSKRVDV